MSWKIEELDQSKTEQCISNETARIDMCKKKLQEYKMLLEYTNKKYVLEISRITNTINNISNSIEEGEKFIEGCRKHLSNDFDTENVN